MRQGAANWERIGTKVVVRSVRVKFLAHLVGSAPSAASFRWMLVYDR